MKKLFTTIVSAFFALTFSATAFAGDKGTADEAVAMVKKAVAYVKAHGKEKAFAEVDNPNGQFKDRDLYIFVVDFNGVVLAHGANPKLIGKNLTDLKDVDGKYFVKTYVDLAQTQGKGWTDFKWVNPVSKAIEPKSAYVEKVDGYLMGCGIYK